MTAPPIQETQDEGDEYADMSSAEATILSTLKQSAEPDEAEAQRQRDAHGRFVAEQDNPEFKEQKEPEEWHKIEDGAPAADGAPADVVADVVLPEGFVKAAALPPEKVQGSRSTIPKARLCHPI